MGIISEYGVPKINTFWENIAPFNNAKNIRLLFNSKRIHFPLREMEDNNDVKVLRHHKCGLNNFVNTLSLCKSSPTPPYVKGGF